MARHTVYVQGGSVQIGDTRHPATACPLIAFDPLSARAYGSGSFALAATASSGLPVSYVSSDHGVATISGSTVTLVGAGAATITASQAGDGVYAAATNISQVLAVNPGVATVALDNLIQGYNGTVRSVTATPTPAGLAVSVTYDGWPTAPTNAGSYTVVATVTDPNCQGSNSATSQITPKALTVRGITAASTIYDGTTTAKLGGAATLLPAEAPGQGTPSDGKPYSSDTVTLGGTAAGTLAAKDVGTRAVTITGNTISGAQAGNYTLAQPTDLTQAVTAKALSVTAPSIAARGYNGTAAAGAVNVGAVSGFVGSETVSATGAAADYASANVGSYPGVDIIYTLHNGTGGGLAGNYRLANGTATGQITSRALLVTGIRASDKVYDGTTNAMLVLTNAALAGNLDGTNVVLRTTNATGAFADPHVGINKTVWVSGLTLSGSATSNYTFSQPATKATITGKPLTITANADSKTYGEVKLYGSGRMEFGTGGGELVSGDDVTSVTLACADGGPATAVVGSYDIIPSAVVGTGLDNYLINYHVGALTVGARRLNLKVQKDSKTYGTPRPYGPGQTTFSTGAGELVNGDRVSSVTLASSDGGAATAVVGSYHLIASAAVGTGLGNYAIHYHDGALTVNPKALNITANGDSKTYGAVKVYGPGQTAFGTGAGELVNGDSVASVTLACLDGGGGHRRRWQLRHYRKCRRGQRVGQLQRQLPRRDVAGIGRQLGPGAGIIRESVRAWVQRDLHGDGDARGPGDHEAQRQRPVLHQRNRVWQSDAAEWRRGGDYRLVLQARNQPGGGDLPA